jgi:hypothetical protein
MIKSSSELNVIFTPEIFDENGALNVNKIGDIMKEYKRWNQILREVGFAGILFGSWIRKELLHRVHQKRFDEFLEFFKHKRDFMIEKVNEWWKSAPLILEQVGIAKFLPQLI